MKFGGTSVGDAAAIKRLIAIVQKRAVLVPVVVVSAISQATNILQEAARLASNESLAIAAGKIADLEKRHIAISKELLSDPALLDKTIKSVSAYFAEVQDLLKGISLLAELSDRAHAKMMSYGELASSTIVAAALTQNQIKNVWLDARNFIYTDHYYLQAKPNIALIEQKTSSLIKPYINEKTIVLTQGFIANTPDKITTVLGREGSDCSATLIGMALDAKEVEIWTDVDGILSCDPKKIINPKLISQISFTEAAELAYFGAKVLHPATLQPTQRKNIPVRVLNSKNPEHQGTLITPDDSSNPDGVKSIACKENIQLMYFSPLDSFTDFGFLRAVFEGLDKFQTKLDVATIAENKLCLLLHNETELNNIIDELKPIARIEVVSHKSLICLVGKNLNQQNYLPGKIFTALRDLNFDLIAQGASTSSLSLVIDTNKLLPALQSLHKEFFEKDN